MVKVINESPLVKFGSKTPRVVIYKSESHKLHQAFNVASGKTIYQGQAVYLDTDGKITPAAADGIYIGIAVTDSVNPAYAAQYGQPIEVTVAVIGYMVLNWVASAALDAGYVAPTGNLLNNHFPIASASNDPTNFIALNAATAANDVIQVLAL